MALISRVPTENPKPQALEAFVQLTHRQLPLWDQSDDCFKGVDRAKYTVGTCFRKKKIIENISALRFVSSCCNTQRSSWGHH